MNQFLIANEASTLIAVGHKGRVKGETGWSLLDAMYKNER